MSIIGFLELPGEIRNQIYNLLLSIPSISTPRQLGDRSIHPHILSTCHQVHDEGREILYGSNTFLAHPSLLSGMPRLRPYYDTISSSTLISMITKFHVRVRLDCDANFSLEKATAAFSGVEELTIEVFQAQFGSSDYKVLKLFEGVRGVGKARIYGSVTGFPHYVEWLQMSMTTEPGQHVRDFQQVMNDKTVRSYDIWTVSEKWEGARMWADWCL